MYAPTGHSTLSPFTASDGENLALHDWALEEGMPLRGGVVVVHGLGEHAGRYGPLAQRLNRWGFAVRAFDQYGHGESDGARGALPRPGRLVDDLADVVDDTRARMPPGLPLVLFGHSMGGLVAGAYAARPGRAVDALVLSSPALDAGLGRAQRFLLATLGRVAPDLRVRNGVDPRALSQDPAVVAAYSADPLVHDRVCGRLARFIAEAGPALLARAPRWRVPTLLVYAGADRVVDPRGSRAFAEAAPRHVVAARCFDRLFHEIFNEAGNEPVFDTLRGWLDDRFGPARAFGASNARP